MEKQEPLFKLCLGCRHYDIIEGCDREEKCLDRIEQSLIKWSKEKGIELP